MGGKRTYKKKNKRKVPRNKITPYPFPKTKVAKLRYVEEITLDTTVPSLTSNGMAVATFRANSCYDPRYALGGHQPRGWDEHTALYREYVVLGSKITFQPVSIGTTGTSFQQPFYMGLIKRNEADPIISASANIGEVMERRMGQYRRLPSIYGKQQTLTATFSHKKTFRTNPATEMIVTEQAALDPEHHADQTHQNSVLYDVYILPNAGAVSNQGPIPCIVTIEYIVLFGNPKALAQS